MKRQGHRRLPTCVQWTAEGLMWLENPPNDVGVKTMPVAIYVRVSTEEQRERQSIDTQTDFAKRFCANQNLQVFQTYADDGISGTVPFEERPGTKQIFRDARLGKFD